MVKSVLGEEFIMTKHTEGSQEQSFIIGGLVHKCHLVKAIINGR